MPEKSEIYAVITGDIVGSSKFSISQRSHFLEVIKASFSAVDETFPYSVHASFEIYRGDAFQGVLSKPGDALSAAIVLRASLRSGFESKRRRKALDARIAIGIGSIDFLQDGRGTEGEGEAFRLSGPILDKMNGDQRMVVRTPSKSIDEELDIECALVDALISKWSSEQAQAILYQIRGLTQKITAEKLGISQPAVLLRLRSAGWWAVEAFIERYKRRISEIISPGTYNGGI